MIRAVIFDLDGTLVQTERLKAISYARAAAQLRPGAFGEEEVVEAFKDVVGLSRREVATRLMQRFELEDACRARMAEFRVSMPWQVLAHLRLRLYEEMLMDSSLLREHQWPHNVALLHESRAAGCRVALATMSHCAQARHVLDVLGLGGSFDFVASREDVEHGKPDPEIYSLVARELGVPPAECLAIEDSPAGVKAALAAGMSVVAVSTPLTRQRLHHSGLLPAEHIVDDPAALPAVVAHTIAHHQREAHP